MGIANILFPVLVQKIHSVAFNIRDGNNFVIHSLYMSTFRMTEAPTKEQERVYHDEQLPFPNTTSAGQEEKIHRLQYKTG